ncbi:MAG: serine hydrolase [Lentisphaeria bacterium]|nr:serine hydrolase [Lentisphaeria bacterium]
MLEQELGDEMREGIIHGAVLAAGTLGGALETRVCGYADPGHTRLMRLDTVIDMASVTKVLATTSAMLLAHDRNLLDFDRPFNDYLPEYRAALPQPIRVRDLAMHRSGFGQQNHYAAETGAEICRNILSVPPPNPFGNYQYSCWNFHLLSMIIEEVTGTTLNVFCRQQIFLPLGMTDSSLGKPVTSDSFRLAQTCATQHPGQISDFIAFRLFRDGFNTGNAGAFSCAGDLAKFCRCLLRDGKTESGLQLFSSEAIQEIRTPAMQAGPVQRSFGWIVEDECKPDGFSPHTAYHSGWSGQTIFLDFERQFYAIVLTTRTLEQYDRAKTGRFKIIAELARKCGILQS